MDLKETVGVMSFIQAVQTRQENRKQLINHSPPDTPWQMKAEMLAGMI